MSVGIDKIGVYIPKYYLDIRDLAKARNVEEEKFTKGLMHDSMAVSPISQDVVSMGAMAAKKIIDNKENISLLIVATESSKDSSKATSTYIHELLELSPYCRAIEIKQACYSATAGIMLAKEYVKANKDKKALVIATDIARYEKNSVAESTQGSGSVALLISENPSIAEIEDKSVFYTKNTHDFFRPIDNMYPVVDGKLSNKMYLHHLEETYNKYLVNNDVNFASICFHVPYPKMAVKAINMIDDKLYEKNLCTISLNSKVGNIYTGSLYLSLYSLLSEAKHLKENDRIGMFSYGSGSSSEFFALRLKEKFKQEKLDLDSRIRLSVTEYEKMFYQNEEKELEYENIGDDFIYFAGIFDQKRKYILNGK